MCFHVKNRAPNYTRMCKFKVDWMHAEACITCVTTLDVPDHDRNCNMMCDLHMLKQQ